MSRFLALLAVASISTFGGFTFNAGAQHYRSKVKNLSSASNTLPSQTSANDSVYTDLASSKCRTIKTGQEYSVQSCPGVGGYKLMASEDDARVSITVVDPRGKEHPLEYWRVITPGFSSLGDKAEWRVKKQKGKITPLALIVRVNASENPEDSSKITSYLTVAKIMPRQICVTDKIAPSATANEEARRAADASSGKPCLE